MAAKTKSKKPTKKSAKQVSLCICCAERPATSDPRSLDPDCCDSCNRRATASPAYRELLEQRVTALEQQLADTQVVLEAFIQTTEQRFDDVAEVLFSLLLQARKSNR